MFVNFKAPFYQKRLFSNLNHLSRFVNKVNYIKASLVNWYCSCSGVLALTVPVLLDYCDIEKFPVRWLTGRLR